MINPIIKAEVVARISAGMSITRASSTYGLARATIQAWCQQCGVTSKGPRGHQRRHSLQEKVEVIRLYQQGLTSRQVCTQMNLSENTFWSWIRDKSKILAVYSVQEPHSRPAVTATLERSGKEAKDVSKPNDHDTKKYIRALKEENEFLKAKAAYLEALMELSGIPASDFKKKPNTKPLTESAKKESET